MLELQFAKSLLRQRPSGLAQSDVDRREVEKGARGSAGLVMASKR